MPISFDRVFFSDPCFGIGGLGGGGWAGLAWLGGWAGGLAGFGGGQGRAGQNKICRRAGQGRAAQRQGSLGRCKIDSKLGGREKGGGRPRNWRRAKVAVTSVVIAMLK